MKVKVKVKARHTAGQRRCWQSFVGGLAPLGRGEVAPASLTRPQRRLRRAWEGLGERSLGVLGGGPAD